LRGGGATGLLPRASSALPCGTPTSDRGAGEPSGFGTSIDRVAPRVSRGELANASRPVQRQAPGACRNTADGPRVGSPGPAVTGPAPGIEIITRRGTSPRRPIHQSSFFRFPSLGQLAAELDRLCPSSTRCSFKGGATLQSQPQGISAFSGPTRRPSRPTFAASGGASLLSGVIRITDASAPDRSGAPTCDRLSRAALRMPTSLPKASRRASGRKRNRHGRLVSEDLPWRVGVHRAA